MQSPLPPVHPALNPAPTTPSRPRYPADLSKSRPLLHRRGTSHMYETLEDLLKEAGYKETRIFTPEAERVKGTADRSRQDTVRGTVVKLLSTWMTKVEPDHDVDHENVPPARLRHTASAPHIRGRSRHRVPPPSLNPNINAPITPAWLTSLFSPRTPPPSPRRPPRTQPRLLSRPRAASGVTITNVVCRPVAVRTVSSSSANPRKGKKSVPMLVCEPCEGNGTRDEDEDDDEDGEVDLARIMIPAKRQHSIRSLRDVLATHPYRAGSPVQRTQSAMGSRERERGAMYARERERAAQSALYAHTVQGSLYNYASTSSGTAKQRSPLAYSTAQNALSEHQQRLRPQYPTSLPIHRPVPNPTLNSTQYHRPTSPSHLAAPTPHRRPNLTSASSSSSSSSNSSSTKRRAHPHHTYTPQLSTSPTAMATVPEQEPETPANEQQPFSSLRVKRRRSGLPSGWVA